MQRGWRKILLVVMLVMVMVPAAPKPAHALFGLDLLLMTATEAATAAFKAAKTAISSYRDVFFFQLSIYSEEKLELAKERAKQELAKRKIEAEVASKLQIPPQRNFCRGVGIARQAMVGRTMADADRKVMTELSGDTMMGVMSVPRPDGGFDHVAIPDKGPDVRSAQGIRNYSINICPYTSDANEIARCKQMGATNTGALKYADVRADTLLGGIAFDDDGQRQAAYKFCLNLTANQTMEKTKGNSIYASQENVMSDLQENSDFATNKLAQMICMDAISQRQPPDKNYGAKSTTAKTGDALDKKYKYLKQVMGWRNQADVTDGSVNRGAWDPEKFSLAQRLLFNDATKPSTLQAQWADIAYMMTDEVLQGRGGTISNSARNVVLSKAQSMALRFEEYRILEKQLLLEAIALGRKSRQNAGRL